MSRTARTLFASTALAASTAAAHTGHGHDGLSFVEGLRHAVGEPDHLLLLAFGFGVATLAAPRVVQGLQRLLRVWQQRRQTRRTAARGITR